jgi:tetratricopeptide (TPR) repeat protein
MALRISNQFILIGAMESEDLIALGYRARREQRPDDAEAAFAEAARLAEEAGDRLPLARALTGVGQMARDAGRVEIALAHYRSAVEILRALDDPLLMAHTVRHVGDILRQLGQPEKACGHYEEALAIYRGHLETPPLDLANTLAGYARTRDDLHDIEAAAALWLKARDLYASVDVQAGVAEADRWLSSHRAAG